MPFGSIHSGPLFKNTNTNSINLGIYRGDSDEYLRIGLLELMEHGMNYIQFPNQLNWGTNIPANNLVKYSLSDISEEAKGGTSTWFWLHVSFGFWILYYSLILFSALTLVLGLY